MDWFTTSEQRQALASQQTSEEEHSFGFSALVDEQSSAAQSKDPVSGNGKGKLDNVSYPSFVNFAHGVGLAWNPL